MSPTPQTNPVKMRAKNVNFYYGSFQALYDINLDFATNKVTAMIGPSGCGKSTFLRNLNRINETLREAMRGVQLADLVRNVIREELHTSSVKSRAALTESARSATESVAI